MSDPKPRPAPRALPVPKPDSGLQTAGKPWLRQKNSGLERRARWDGGKFAYPLLGAAVLAQLLVSINTSWGDSPFSRFCLVLGAGVMILAATYGVGWFAGFLLGSPKVNPNATGTERYQASTNLEKISDWLPTALTGAGLAGATWIGVTIHGANTGLGAKIGVHELLLNAMMVVGVVAGLVRGYLETRLNLRKSMQDSDDECEPSGHGQGDVADDSPRPSVPMPLTREEDS